MIVVIDDERTFAEHVDVYLRTADEALAWLARTAVHNDRCPRGAEIALDQIWFDHDLGDGGDAIVVAKFYSLVDGLVGCCGRPKIYIHSQNPVGAGNLAPLLPGSKIVGLPPLTKWKEG